jgi:hypothetical protein
MKTARDIAERLHNDLSIAAFNHPGVHGQGLPGGCAIPIIEQYIKNAAIGSLNYVLNHCERMVTHSPSAYNAVSEIEALLKAEIEKAEKDEP